MRLRAVTTRLQSTYNSVQSLRALVWAKAHQRVLAATIIGLCLAFLTYYITANPFVIESVFDIGLARAALILLLYFSVLLTNVGIMQASVHLCRKALPIKQGFFLTIYSSVINFFGPLQSGPGIRALYLKTRVSIRIRDYTLAMFFYFITFAAFNISLLFITTAWWLSFLGVVITIVGTGICTRLLGFSDRKRYILSITVFVLIQIILMICIYMIEIGATTDGRTISLSQAAVYTGSANLTLFVNITPGGIGIREAFIVFTTSLHHIKLSTVIATGVLDRALYIIFLLMLFIVSSGLHLRESLVPEKHS